MKITSLYLSIATLAAVLVYVACRASTNSPATNPAPTLQSVSTNGIDLAAQERQRAFDLAFREGVLYGAAVVARNPDAVNDQQFLIRMAYAYRARDQQAAQKK